MQLHDGCSVWHGFEDRAHERWRVGRRGSYKDQVSVSEGSKGGGDGLTDSRAIIVGVAGGVCHTRNKIDDGGWCCPWDAVANGVGRKRLSVIVVDGEHVVRTSWAAINEGLFLAWFIFTSSSHLATACAMAIPRTHLPT